MAKGGSSNRVSIFVFDRGDNAIDNAKVMMYNHTPPLSSSTSNPYVFTNVQKNVRTINVKRRGYKEKDVTINVKPGSNEKKVVLEEEEWHKVGREYKEKREHYKNLKVREKEKKKLLKDLKKEYKTKMEDAIRKRKEEKGEFIKTDEMKRLEREQKVYGGRWNPLHWNRRLARYSQEKIGVSAGSHVMSVINVLAMIIAGMIISQFIEGTWAGNFTLGFLMLGISTLLPKPEPIEDLGKVIMTYPEALKVWKHTKNNNWAGPIKSALKFFAVWFFLMGARNATIVGFLGNIIMIIVAALAYFSFSSEFDQKVPGQIFEAVAKFFIGMIVIPWWVFYGIFQSLILGIMAMAFFAVPPVASKDKEGESTIRGEYSRWLFLVLMVIALVGSGVFGDAPVLGMQTWGLTGALKSTFLYFWLVTAIAGFFSPSGSRPAIGFIMLSAATMIYAVGPGTQEVGTALLGPWFGKTFAGLTSIMAPVTEAFGQLGATFGTAFQMILNPVGFAQGIMTGTYTTDTDTGLTGAFGVEVTNFRATPIYAGQPYNIIIPIENKGSSKASNIMVALYAGTGVRVTKYGDVVGTDKNLPKEDKNNHWHSFDIVPGKYDKQMETVPAPIVEFFKEGGWKVTDKEVLAESMHVAFYRESLDLSGLGIDGIGFEEQFKCVEDGEGKIKSCYVAVGRDLEKLDSEQVFFSSRTDSGIPCSSVVDFGLMTQKGSKFLPFTAVITYDYSIESSMEIEAMSQEEWSRLAQEGLLYPGIKKPSIMANSPAMLNLDTLEQPIREGTPFYIAFNLTPAIPGKGWIEEARVDLEMPKELHEKFTRCTTDPIIRPEGTRVIFSWDKRTRDTINTAGTFPTGQHAIYCYFTGMPVTAGKPTDTYYIKASSEFKFNDVNTKAFALEFGGMICCAKDEDCPGENVRCEKEGEKKNQCVTYPPETDTMPDEPDTDIGDEEQGNMQDEGTGGMTDI